MLALAIVDRLRDVNSTSVVPMSWKRTVERVALERWHGQSYAGASRQDSIRDRRGERDQFALGRAFAEAGMKVMLADIETDALAAAVESLHDFGPDVRGVTCDVADPASVERAAKASYEAFGNVHVVCNNAGVAGGSGIDDILLDNWRWVLDVNLMGVVHGIRTFLPHIRGHGEGGHIVNTASMAGDGERARG